MHKRELPESSQHAPHEEIKRKIGLQISVNAHAYGRQHPKSNAMGHVTVEPELSLSDEGLQGRSLRVPGDTTG
jgi:hypothetical protein